MNLFTSKSSGQKSKEDLLDTVLYKVPGTKTTITWADAVEGTLITGATGSGKSSGAGKICSSCHAKRRVWYVHPMRQKR